jgi:hypothetical protein
LEQVKKLDAYELYDEDEQVESSATLYELSMRAEIEPIVGLRATDDHAATAFNKNSDDESCTPIADGESEGSSTQKTSISRKNHSIFRLSDFYHAKVSPDPIVVKKNMSQVLQRHLQGRSSSTFSLSSTNATATVTVNHCGGEVDGEQSGGANQTSPPPPPPPAVYMSKQPLFSPEECREVIGWAEKHARDKLLLSRAARAKAKAAEALTADAKAEAGAEVHAGVVSTSDTTEIPMNEVEVEVEVDDESGGWTTSRHYSVPTTDLPVHEIPELLRWFKRQLREILGPMLATQFIHGDVDVNATATGV